MELRRPETRDVDALLAFFAAVPAHERTFFKEEVLDRAAVEGWVRDERGRRAIACEDGAVAGYAAVVPLPGWSDHVGELRLVVHPARRRSGVGRALARWALLEAVHGGLRKVVVEVVADQEGAVAMFQALGFRGEALLHDHVRDHDGELRDLVLLAHPVDEQWEAMASLGLDVTA
ncbi:MAG: GNAT family N-acetyltransferase [Solirubrobacterales bacterium]|nr:GNAT family N-acetyltransferase [Solirubrobacterales bacterium]